MQKTLQRYGVNIFIFQDGETIEAQTLFETRKQWGKIMAVFSSQFKFLILT